MTNRLANGRRIIKQSCLFDEYYYLKKNPDVAQSGINPITHYLLHGAREGRDPCKEFDTRFYLTQHRDVAAVGMNPLLHYINFGKAEGRTIRATRDFLRDESKGLKLSVIIVSHNMARELPRTIRSFSPAMQRNIAADDYEVIVVDNGSTQPLDQTELFRWGGNVSFHSISKPTPSPVPAINCGLGLARGELACVCIDGARMASPGLLSSALAASRLQERPVIGTLSLHLGPDLQPRSLVKGYNQGAEDRLLEESRWTENGYRLFRVAKAFGNGGGWFKFPFETNALFLKLDHWRELGGYAPRFVSPGGGLVNLDTWKRVCTAPPAGSVIMLLGEAVFHQFHGGVSSNSPNPPMEAWHNEYIRIRGAHYAPPAKVPCRWYAAREDWRKNLKP
jgi:hypothetical protein